MRALIKISLLALFSSTALAILPTSRAMAGTAGVTPPDSGGVNVGDSFAPPAADDADSGSSASNNNNTPAAISNAIAVVLETIETTQSVTSPTGEPMPLTSAQAETITAALTATGADIEPAIAALEQQLSAELGGLGIEIEVVGPSPANLEVAIAAANALIDSLSSAELAAALESPTFVAIRNILAGSKEGGSDGDRERLASGGGTSGIPILSAP